ncbi:hypothetical protein AVEN_69571-1 [Araneus ventricosus]|uniref:Uncharacterized protein n=1 Tax=Araneus ventricosus TaxID=182803 RepID=A0A4Y2HAR7_ARAVE|nr:hypothetical protein AVEN_69571-1 [Araneus ventricosus]
MTWTTPYLAHPLSKLLTTLAGGHLAPADLTCTRLAYTAILWWNLVSSLEPSDPEVETLLQGHRGLAVYFILNQYSIEVVWLRMRIRWYVGFLMNSDRRIFIFARIVGTSLSVILLPEPSFLKHAEILHDFYAMSSAFCLSVSAF